MNRLPDRSSLGRFIRFGLTGLTTTGVHFLVAIALVELLHTSPTVANGVAFVTATVTSFVINTLWSFKSRVDVQTFTRYVTVAAVGLGLTLALSSLLDGLGVHYILAIFLITLINPPIIFVLHNAWTYRTSSSPAKGK